MSSTYCFDRSATLPEVKASPCTTITSDDVPYSINGTSLFQRSNMPFEKRCGSQTYPSPVGDQIIGFPDVISSQILDGSEESLYYFTLYDW